MPDHIRQPLNQTFGDAAISLAEEIIEDGSVSYDLISKGPDGAMEIRVRGDGAILGYSAKLKLPEK